jgi:hypothetical protein
MLRAVSRAWGEQQHRALISLQDFDSFRKKCIRKLYGTGSISLSAYCSCIQIRIVI